jgi:UDP-N-acetylglucosamine--N-acetylmuramyl-(pentapeptide) pyrophosphoryl-undecaprenol N-acetylglucosamine transferase
VLKIAMNPQKKSILIAASGTGGHIFPALAVAKELQEFDIHWLGVPGRLEEQLVVKDYPLTKVSVEGLIRPSQWLGAGSKLVRSTFQVRSLLQNLQAKAVFSTGGYIAGPSILAARSLGLPVLLHESNALPGKVTRFLAPLVDCLALGFDEAREHLKGKGTWVGTPFREDCLAPSPLVNLPENAEIPAEAPVIVVLGGSQGARGLNQVIVDSLPDWIARGIYIIHLTGQGEYDRVVATAPKSPYYKPLPFWNQMGPLYYRADLVISRAGAGTITELMATGRPSILVPYPFAAEDHQTFNAQTLVSRGAALMFQERQIERTQFTRLVLELFDSPQTLSAMGQKAHALAKPRAAQDTAELLRNLVNP